LLVSSVGEALRLTGGFSRQAPAHGGGECGQIIWALYFLQQVSKVDGAPGVRRQSSGAELGD
jgi:hypothetical protein